MAVIKYLFRSSVLRNTTYLLSIATGLVVTPILVRTLGKAEYAKWVLLNTMLLYFMMFDFGYSLSVSRFVSRKWEEWGEDSIQKCIATAFYVLCGASAAALILVSAGYSYFKAKYMADMPEDLAVSVMFLILSFASMIPLRVFQGVLSSQLKWNTISMIVMTKAVTMNGVIVYMVLNGYGLYGVILPNAIFIFLEYLAYYIFAKKALDFSLSLKFWDTQTLKTLSSFSLSLFLHNAAFMFGSRMQNYFIALYISLPAVTIYTIGMQLLKYFDDLMRSTFDVMVPYFSKHEDDHERMTDDYITVSSYSFSVAAFGGFMIATYCQSFLYFWVGPDLVPSSSVVYILAIPYVLFASHIPSRGLLIGTSKQKFMVVLSVTEFLVNVSTLFYVVPRYGMQGILWTSATLMVVFRGLIFPVMLFRKMRIPAMRYLYQVYAKSLVIYVLPQFLIYHFVFTRFDKFSWEIGWPFLLNILVFLATFLFRVRKAIKKPKQAVEQGG